MTFRGTVLREVGTPDELFRATSFSLTGIPSENTWNATRTCCPGSRSFVLSMPSPTRTPSLSIM